MIKIDANLCLGCKSCSNVCPSQNITMRDDDGRRTVHLKSCKEDCDLCVKVCPTGSLSLVSRDEIVAETATVPDVKISFDLVACNTCRSRYATEPMLRWIESSLPRHIQKDAAGLEWIRICPACRRNVEAERMVEQILPGRRKKDWRCSWLFQSGKKGLHPARARLLYELIVLIGMII